MQRAANFFIVFLFVMLYTGVSGIAEEITLTTYYPAPFGNYEELQASRFAVGSTTTMPAQDGDMAALRIAIGSGVTMPTTDGDLAAGGTIRANTGFNVDGTDGDTVTFIVITNIKQAGLNLQAKTATITVQGGIITDVNVAPNWQDMPLP